jgi:hypothetical protein
MDGLWRWNTFNPIHSFSQRKGRADGARPGPTGNRTQYCFSLQSWRWRHLVPPKLRYQLTRLRGVETRWSQCDKSSPREPQNLYRLCRWGEYWNLTERNFGAGIATVYGLDGRGVRVRIPVGVRFFSPPRHPDRGPPSLLSNRYGGLFPWG